MSKKILKYIKAQTNTQEVHLSTPPVSTVHLLEQGPD